MTCFKYMFILFTDIKFIINNMGTGKIGAKCAYFSSPLIWLFVLGIFLFDLSKYFLRAPLFKSSGLAARLK